MAATVAVHEWTGVTPDSNEVSAVRLCTTDNYNPGSTYPCVIPASDLYYSYWKHICLDLSGTFTTINNVRIYTDGTLGWTLGTDGKVVIGQKDDPGEVDEGHGCPVGSYDQSAGTAGTTGYALKDVTNGHTYYKGETAAVADLFSFTSGSPCTVDSADHSSAGQTKAAVIQGVIDDDATQGTMSAETVTIVYDEI